MSRIGDIGVGGANLVAVLAEYDKHLTELEPRISLKGKTIEAANKEQVAWYLFYDQKRAELDTLAKYMWTRVERERSILLKKYTEVYSKVLSERAKDKYIDKDEEFLVINELYLEVYELHEKYKSVVEAFKARGFALRNIGALRIASLQDGIL